ncbi:MAG: hypothetical protein LBO66_09760 [Deltaproteobacteria bacterium]|nr:hypothetical protein [Deltaproteobacteria bacterium]
MSNRKCLKSGIFATVNARIEKAREFIAVQKFSFALFEYGKAAGHNMDAASVFTIGALDTSHET